MNQSKTTTHGTGWVLIPVMTALGLLLLLFTFVVLFAAHDHATRDTASKPRTSKRVSLPQQCAQFYNNGTDQWIECMGVGRK